MAVRQLSSRLLAQLQRRGTGLQPPSLLPSSAGALPLLAWFGTSTSPPLDASEVAKALRCQQFLADELEPLRTQTSALPHSQLLDFMEKRGFTPSAADDVLGRLERSGALLNLGGTVILRPGEVAEALALVLPSSSSLTQQRLAEAQQELQQLEAQQAGIGRRAAWRQQALVWGGLTTQAAFWALLFRLTFYELSWDVMEPICFFAGGAQVMLCYFYFMLTRREFSWETVLERHVGRWEAEQLQRIGFASQRYVQLKKEVRRLGELLQAQQARSQLHGHWEEQQQQQQQQQQPPSGDASKEA